MSNIYFCGNKSNFSQFPTVTPTEIIDYFSSKPQLSGDTETKGRDPHSKRILSLQLGDRDTQFVIDVRSVNILLFKDLIESKLTLWHNASFDYKFLLHAGIVLGEVYDTMLAEVVIFNGLNRRYGLNHLVKNYLDIELSKDTRGEFYKVKDEPFTDKQIEYAGLDVAHLDKIKDIQKKYIDHYDIQPAIDVEMEAVKSFADMEYNGIYLDSKQWKSVANTKQDSLNALEYDLDTYLINSGVYNPIEFGQDLFGNKIRQLKINYSSPTQVLDVLKRLGIQAEDTSARTLDKLKGYEFVRLLLTHRELSKKVSTYGYNFLNYIRKSTGRIHTDFWQVKHTFRVGSGNKKANAPNVQNIPSADEYRNCFKPRKGYKWVSIDYSSQELRLMADFSGEEKFINALNEGKDLHCFAYNTMTGENITKADKEKRTKAKTINFGKPYGMSPYKLSDTLSIPLEEAEDLFDKYSKAFPQLNKWLEKQWELGNTQGYIILNRIHKGKRWFPEQEYKKGASWKEKNRLKGIIGRASMNTPIQGTGAISMKEALSKTRQYLIDKELWQNKVYMICTVHDQVDFEVHNDYLDIIPDIEKIMIEEANKYVTKVKMEVDTSVTQFWQK